MSWDLSFWNTCPYCKSDDLFEDVNTKSREYYCHCCSCGYFDGFEWLQNDKNELMPINTTLPKDELYEFNNLQSVSFINDKPLWIITIDYGNKIIIDWISHGISHTRILFKDKQELTVLLPNLVNAISFDFSYFNGTEIKKINDIDNLKAYHDTI